MENKIDPNTMLDIIENIVAVKMATIEVDVPEIMLDAIDHIISDETLGFTDRDEFVREAFRRMVMTYG